MGYLEDKRVLVTGGHGFLGSAVVDQLRECYCAKVIAPSHSKFDLVDMRDVRNLYDTHMPNVVIHLAAMVGGIGANQLSPAKFFYNNIMMGLNMMEIGCWDRIQKFVMVGTVCSYPKYTPIPFKEDDLWNGYPEETNAPYGIAKKALLTMSQAYRQEYGFNSIYLIPVNIYGPRDHIDSKTSHVIPALIEKILDAKLRNLESITVWGTGNATREFIYVEDAAKGIIQATEIYNKPDPINLGSGEQISIWRLAQVIAEIIGWVGEIHWDDSKPDGQPKRLLDSTKALQEFNFKATTTLEEGLIKTINWHKVGHI